MKSTILLCLLLLVVQTASAFEVSSLQPGAGQPGALVTLTGTGGPSHLTLKFNETAVSTRTLAPGVYQFLVPELPPGDYAVEVTSGGQPSSTSPTFWFQILAPAPSISSLTPNTFSFCRGNGPEELEVKGEGFAKTAVVLLDGSGIPVVSRSSGSLGVRLPPLPAGLHRIQVANPDGQESLPVTLSVVKQPVIHQVTSGSNDVTSYRLTISGENFSPHSRLLVNDTPIQMTGNRVEIGDRFSYVDCRTLSYLRYPPSGQTQELEFKVINPDGQVSNSYTISGY